VSDRSGSRIDLTLIVDSFAWIEFLSAGRAGPSVRTHLESSEELVTPDIVLAEVARVFGRQGMPRITIEGHLRSIGVLSSVRPIDVQVAIEAIESEADLRQKARSEKLGMPSFADCIILAFARSLQAQVLTADSHFRGLQETVWIGV